MAFAPIVSTERPITHLAYFESMKRGRPREEYVDGALVNVPAVTHAHQTIVANVLTALRPQVTHGPCELLADVLIGNGPVPLQGTPPGRFSYAISGVFLRPDLVIMLDRQDYFGPSNSAIRNPTVVLEVLLPDEEEYAAGVRFAALRHWLERSFTDYVLVATGRPAIAHYRREGVHDWPLEVHQTTSAVLKLSRVGVALTLAEVYAHVRDRAGRPFVGPPACPHCGHPL